MSPKKGGASHQQAKFKAALISPVLCTRLAWLSTPQGLKAGLRHGTAVTDSKPGGGKRKVAFSERTRPK